MKISTVIKTLVNAIRMRHSILLVGQPGCGKTDSVFQAVVMFIKMFAQKARLIVMHPVVSDPTDFKGFPFPDAAKGIAKFLPFGDLAELLEVPEDEIVVVLLDDLGQAPTSVQAAVMQLILARRINGHKISDNVVFIAATNRHTDRAGVSGILEPVKSRFKAIINVEIDNEDWYSWAIANDQPPENIAFNRFRPEFLSAWKPTPEIKNGPCPRTIANVGCILKAGYPEEAEYELIAGAAGEAYATEMMAFLKVFRSLPDMDLLIKDPLNAPVPTDPAAMIATCSALARKCNKKSAPAIIAYAMRLRPEYSVMLLLDAIKVDPVVQTSVGYDQWIKKYSNVIV